LLEHDGPTQAIFAEVKAHLSGKGIALRSDTLIDATEPPRTPTRLWVLSTTMFSHISIDRVARVVKTPKANRQYRIHRASTRHC